MKKFCLIMAGVLAVAAIGLTACGAPADPAVHNITCAENDDYRVIDLSAKGQAGSDILFDVVSESVFYEIGEVSYNGTPIEKGSLGYKFTMPDEDVTIEVRLTPVTEYDDPDDYLSWGSTVIDEISVASEEDMGYTALECTQELPLVFDMSKFGEYNNVLDRSEILSSDQNVIPDEALSFDPLLASEITSGGTNTVRGGSLVVDLKKIAPGTATIYLYLDYNNSGSAALMRTFTVTEYGEIEIDTLDVPFAVKNNTSYDDEENITISFTDSDPVYGSNAPERQSFKLSELTSGEGTFGYAVGHTYSISASRAVLSDDGIHYDPGSVVSFSVSDWVGPGSSVTGFVKIEDGELTLPNVPATPVQITMND